MNGEGVIFVGVKGGEESNDSCPMAPFSQKTGGKVFLAQKRYWQITKEGISAPIDSGHGWRGSVN